MYLCSMIWSRRSNSKPVMLFGRFFVFRKKKCESRSNPDTYPMEVISMRDYNTFAETEALLRTAINQKGRSVKDISAATDIKPSTLYKWKTTDVHLSPDKADALLLYFIQNEPQRLEDAEIVLAAHSNHNNILITPCLHPLTGSINRRDEHVRF